MSYVLAKTKVGINKYFSLVTMIVNIHLWKTHCLKVESKIKIRDKIDKKSGTFKSRKFSFKFFKFVIRENKKLENRFIN